MLSEELFIQLIINQWKKIAKLYAIEWKDSFIKWDLPASLEADFAVVFVLKIANQKQADPYQVALEISRLVIPNHAYEVFVTKEGYINCRFRDHFYHSHLIAITENNSFFFLKKNPLEINIEFVSVNPTGDLHLGHLRNAFVGDVIANLYNFLGHNVTREYYINDQGNQISQLVKSVLFFCRQQKNLPQQISESDLSYRGSAIREAASYLVNNSNFLFGEDQQDSAEFRASVIDFFVNRIKLDLLSCGVQFDNWFSEKEMYLKDRKHELLLEKLTTTGLAYWKDGALFLSTGSYEDDKDRVLIKTSGEFTYFFSDILYHVDKLQRANFLINIWGSDHHGYIERIRSSLKMLGYEDNRLSIVLIQVVSLLSEEGNKKFSKRMGTAIELKETLAVVGADQLRFCLLEKEVNHPLVLNLAVLSEQEEKSRLYYIQYAHARCNQILVKYSGLNANEIVNSNLIDPFLLCDGTERKIMNTIIRFPLVITSAADEQKPFLLIQYLQSLAKDFQFYYQSSPILSSHSELLEQKILLVKAVKITLKQGLLLCGVAAPDLMKSKAIALEG